MRYRVFVMACLALTILCADACDLAMQDWALADPNLALYHADTFGFYATGLVSAKRDMHYLDYIQQQNKGGKK